VVGEQEFGVSVAHLVCLWFFF
jgi:histone H2B